MQKNKMRAVGLIIVLLYLSGGEMMAQVCDPLAGRSCEEADVFCSLDSLDGFICRNPPPPNQSGPFPLCPGGGVSNNTRWMAFVAESDSTAFRISGFNCIALGGIQGIQTGIYTDCSFGISPVCIPECFTGSDTLAFRSVPCQTYYLFVDGCNGSQCDFTIDVLHGKDPDIFLDSFELVSPDTLCLGASVCVEAVLPGPCTPSIMWRVNGVVQEDDSLEICLEDLSGGTIQVCAKAMTGNAQRICRLSEEWICRDIFVEHEPLERYLGRDTFCYEDRFGLFFTECSAPVVPVPGLKRICCIRKNAFGCDEEICKDFYIRPQPTAGYELVVLCEEEPYTLPSGQVVTQCGNYIAYVPQGSETGCDTTIRVDVAIFETQIQLRSGRCQNENTCLQADLYIKCPFFGVPQFSSHWIEKFSGDIVAQDTVRVCLPPGEYCFVLQSTFRGTVCPPKQKCIVVSDPRPAPPEFVKTNVLCKDSTLIQAVTNEPDPHLFFWSVSEGTILGSRNGPNLRLDLSDVQDDRIVVCVRVENECGSSAENCDTIPLYSGELQADFSNVIIEDSVSFLAMPDSALSYNWDFGDGSSSFEKDPVHVYDTPGIYTVRLIVKDACQSDTVEKQITVIFTSINLHDLDHGISMYPNPSDGWFFLKTKGPIKIAGKLTVRISDIQGRIHKDFRLTNEKLKQGTEIDLSDSPEGLYLIRISDGNSLYSGRLVLIK